MRFKPKQFFYNGWIILDETGNWLTGGASDETMSGRMGRAVVEKRKGFSGWLARTICKGLNVFGKDHCVETYKSELEHAHRPESLDDKPGD